MTIVASMADYLEPFSIIGFFLLFSCGAGCLIGRFNHRGMEGAVLGLLGPVGWLIAALLRPPLKIRAERMAKLEFEVEKKKAELRAKENLGTSSADT